MVGWVQIKMHNSATTLIPADIFINMANMKKAMDIQ